jgi:transcriptional regulator
VYIPKPFALNDRAAAFAIIRDNNFGLLVSAEDGVPMATHVPFLLDPDRGEQGTLLAHVARANPHGASLRRLAERGGEALCVFQGAHAYISPTWYGTAEVVPTWNYLAVHAAGTPRVLDDSAEVRALLERLVGAHEAGRPRPWSLDRAPADYLSRQIRAITAFEIPIARLEAVAKLNQNKPVAMRRGVVAALAAGDEPAARAVAAHMERDLEA